MDNDSFVGFGCVYRVMYEHSVHFLMVVVRKGAMFPTVLLSAVTMQLFPLTQRYLDDSSAKNVARNFLDSLFDNSLVSFVLVRSLVEVT